MLRKRENFFSTISTFTTTAFIFLFIKKESNVGKMRFASLWNFIRDLIFSRGIKS